MKYSSQSYSILRSNEVVAAVVLQKPRVPVTFSPQLYPFLPEVNPGDQDQHCGTCGYPQAQLSRYPCPSTYYHGLAVTGGVW